MGYTGEPDGGETLFVAGNGGASFSKGLGFIDTSSFKLLNVVGQFTLQQLNCELSGTGAGQFGGAAWSSVGARVRCGERHERGSGFLARRAS